MGLSDRLEELGLREQDAKRGRRGIMVLAKKKKHILILTQ